MSDGRLSPSLVSPRTCPRDLHVQMYQAKLFENQNTRDGKKSYGGSQHYHYVVPPSEPVTYNGSKMVHSSILEMLSHVSIFLM